MGTRFFLPHSLELNCFSQPKRNYKICLVGVARFELTTPRPPDECATGLRYTPKMMYLLEIGVKKSDPSGARTQDPILKRDVLYQLS